MSCGIPVLASNRGGSLPEVVGDAGLLFEPEDPDAIASCVIGFLRDDELRATLSRNALERSRLFSWSRGAALAEESFRRCYAHASSKVV
jgi:glycosyltransferase involved in cell wall biosynthesis